MRTRIALLGFALGLVILGTSAWVLCRRSPPPAAIVEIESAEETERRAQQLFRLELGDNGKLGAAFAPKIERATKSLRECFWLTSLLFPVPSEGLSLRVEETSTGRFAIQGKHAEPYQGCLLEPEVFSVVSDLLRPKSGPIALAFDPLPLQTRIDSRLDGVRRKRSCESAQRRLDRARRMRIPDAWFVAEAAPECMTRVESLILLGEPNGLLRASDRTEIEVYLDESRIIGQGLRRRLARAYIGNFVRIRRELLRPFSVACASIESHSPQNDRSLAEKYLDGGDSANPLAHDVDAWRPECRVEVLSLLGEPNDAARLVPYLGTENRLETQLAAAKAILRLTENQGTAYEDLRQMVFSTLIQWVRAPANDGPLMARRAVGALDLLRQADGPEFEAEARAMMRRDEKPGIASSRGSGKLQELLSTLDNGWW